MHTDVVVHLAAAVGVTLIIERTLQSLINNIRGTVSISGELQSDVDFCRTDSVVTLLSKARL
jgi:hypothetical protein